MNINILLFKSVDYIIYFLWMFHTVHNAVMPVLVQREVQSADPAATELAHNPVRAGGREYALALRGVSLSAPRVHGLCDLGVASTSLRVVVRLHLLVVLDNLCRN